jgi:hypothetical protein
LQFFFVIANYHFPNIDQFLDDWDSVLNRLKEKENIDVLEQYLTSHGYRARIKTKDIFDNIQILSYR